MSAFDDRLSEWQVAMAEGDFGRALLLALEGYELSLKQGDELLKKQFVSNLKIATDQLHETLVVPPDGEHDFKRICSFCYKPIGNSLFVLGASVSICAECIALASKLIRK